MDNSDAFFIPYERISWKDTLTALSMLDLHTGRLLYCIPISLKGIQRSKQLTVLSLKFFKLLISIVILLASSSPVSDHTCTSCDMGGYISLLGTLHAEIRHDARYKVRGTREFRNEWTATVALRNADGTRQL